MKRLALAGLMIALAFNFSFSASADNGDGNARGNENHELAEKAAEIAKNLELVKTFASLQEYQKYIQLQKGIEILPDAVLFGVNEQGGYKTKIVLEDSTSTQTFQANVPGGPTPPALVTRNYEDALLKGNFVIVRGRSLRNSAGFMDETILKQKVYDNQGRLLFSVDGEQSVFPAPNGKYFADC